MTNKREELTGEKIMLALAIIGLIGVLLAAYMSSFNPVIPIGIFLLLTTIICLIIFSL